MHAYNIAKNESRIAGPSLSIKYNEDIIYLSTIAEKSVINDSNNTYFYAFHANSNPKEIFKIPRDLKFLKNMRPYFLHPSLKITTCNEDESMYTVLL